MNLLPLMQQASIAQIKYIKNIFVISALCTFVIAFLVFIFYHFKHEHMQKNITQIQSQISEQTQSALKAQMLSDQILILQNKINTANDNQWAAQQLYQFLSLLPQIMPADLYLIHLSWHHQSGIIEGYAMGNHVISVFLETLKSHSDFKAELIKSESQNKSTYFRIHFHADD